MGASDRQVLFPEPVGARINEPGQHSAAAADGWKRKTSTVELEGPRGPAIGPLVGCESLVELKYVVNDGK